MKVKGWARTAYDGYRDYYADYWAHSKEKQPPAFEDLPDDVQGAWIRAANTLVDACREWVASGRCVGDDGTVFERDGKPAKEA